MGILFSLRNGVSNLCQNIFRPCKEFLENEIKNSRKNWFLETKIKVFVIIYRFFFFISSNIKCFLKEIDRIINFHVTQNKIESECGPQKFIRPLLCPLLNNQKYFIEFWWRQKEKKINFNFSFPQLSLGEIERKRFFL